MSCYHCGEPVPAQLSVEHELGGVVRRFCCVGCGFIASAIYAQGLQAYYQHRQLPARKAELIPPELLASISACIERQIDNVGDGAGPTRDADRAHARPVEVCVFIEGLNCPACSWLIERSLQQLHGIERVVTSLSARRTRVSFHEAEVSLEQILNALQRIGYRALPYQADTIETALATETSSLLKRLGVAALCMMQAMMFSFSLFAGLIGVDGASGSTIASDEASWLRWGALLSTVPVLLYCATPFYRNALTALRLRSLNMDVSVTLAMLAAFVASSWHTLRGSGAVYFDSVAMFAFLLLLGRYLELRVRSKATLLAATHQRLLPLLVRVLRPVAHSEDGPAQSEKQWQQIALMQVQKCEQIRICAGEVVAADGVIVRGMAELDESVLTGEALARTRAVGAQVCAGAIVRNGSIDIEVNKIGSETYLAQLSQLQDRALSERAPLQFLADKYASYFVGVVIALSIAAYFFWASVQPERAFSVLLAVLVVTCPCALSLALPTAWASATRFLLGRGFLLRRARALETLAQIDEVMLDKTGTLSTGELQISAVQLLANIDMAKVRALVGALEQHSTHACARALRAWSASTEQNNIESDLAITELQELAGAGLSACINGEKYYLGQRVLLPLPLQTHANSECIYLASEHDILASFQMRDELKADALSFVNALRARGLRISLASGDAPAAVEQCARRLQIQDFSARQSPADKLAKVRALQQQGRRVLMLGDGINDAPVLAGADVSIAVSASTDFARRAADAVLTAPSLHTVLAALDCARRTRTIVRQNLLWALAYNLAALPSALLGFLSPWEAAAGMSISSLLVTLNSLRLQRQATHNATAPLVPLELPT